MPRIAKLLAVAFCTAFFVSVGPVIPAQNSAFAAQGDACAASECYSYAYCQLNTIDDTADCYATTTDMDCCCGPMYME